MGEGEYEMNSYFRPELRVSMVAARHLRKSSLRESGC